MEREFAPNALSSAQGIALLKSTPGGAFAAIVLVLGTQGTQGIALKLSN